MKTQADQGIDCHFSFANYFIIGAMLMLPRKLRLASTLLLKIIKIQTPTGWFVLWQLVQSGLAEPAVVQRLLGRVKGNQSSDKGKSDKGNARKGDRQLFCVRHLVRVAAEQSNVIYNQQEHK
jgi:hypothetical protein